MGSAECRIWWISVFGGHLVQRDQGCPCFQRGAADWSGLSFRLEQWHIQLLPGHVIGSTKLDSTALALSKVTAAGAEDGQLVLSLSNGKTINYSQIKALV